jgi:hypothetical protein
MSKFWGAVGTLAVIGITLILVGNQIQPGINFSDLETECRYNQEQLSSVKLDAESNRLNFAGQFHINSTESDLNYNYRTSNDKIKLNVIAEDLDRPESYLHTCLGLARYEGQTDDIQSGRYVVEVQHNGEVVKKRVMRIG